MRRAAAFTVLLGLAGCVEPPDADATLRSVVSEPEGSTGVAVVELFTSEGCSSCPPADAVLRALAARADSTGEPVLPLSFHVDYWNGLGWADPYSDPEYTARQRAYAASGAFEGRVYTPAMIVGGRGGFVGSRRRTAEQRVAAALGAPLSVPVRLAAEARGRSVIVEHGADSAPEGAHLHLALVQEETGQSVPRGENRGRRLSHVRVVRAFASTSPMPGTTTLSAPDDLDLSAARIVGYVQPDRVGPVLGAAEVRL